MKKGQMKEFHKKANELLKIRRAHPVVSKIKKIDEQGKVTVSDFKQIVEREVANNFIEIYKIPTHKVAPARNIDYDVEDEDMQINTRTVAVFTRDVMEEAINNCNMKQQLNVTLV
jgi:uncharacterized protein (DUF927 family)